MTETQEEIQARHRKEQRDLQSRITNKKKGATKKTRKGVNDECANLERDLKERQERELAAFNGETASGDENQVAEGEKEDGNNDNDNENENDDTTNGITDRLKDTTISSDASQTQKVAESPQAQGQGQQPAKKRNRQKERMARRAAEQEAEAERAAQEAQGMTDHRGVERSSLERTFAAHGLVEHEIRPDGHCLFSAVADQLAQRGLSVSIHNGGGGGDKKTGTGTEGGKRETDPSYRTVRRAATDYIQAHADDFVPFLEEPLDTYIPKIRDTAEWGGQLELLALASAYGVEIKVVQNGRTETIQPQSRSGGEGETIWLAYYRHGYGLGEHYNSLRVKG